MPEIHGPSFYCPDLSVDLPLNLGPLLGLCPLFFREPPMGGVQRREPRALPSSVRGPVLAPPWRRQRPTGSLAGRWQSVPLRVRASHLVPGQFWPKRVSWPIVLPLVNISNTPIIRCYIITNIWLLIKAVYLDLRRAVITNSRAKIIHLLYK